jgi:hypothetical protein
VSTCGTFSQKNCQRIVPPCPPPRPARCLEGRCAI